MSRSKRRLGYLFYTVFLVASTGLILEIGLRLWFASQIGPRVLAYGTESYRNDRQGARATDLRRDFFQRRARDHSMSDHENERVGYSKFFPGEQKVTYDVDTGEVFPVRINDHGFRGDDFAADKPAGVVRVVALGSSSTVGYYNGDDTTYPKLLEDVLNDACDGGPKFEVLNLGVPHLTSGQIVALLREEGLAFSPDVVTFYEGRNDSAVVGIGGPPVRARDPSLGEWIAEAMRERLLLVHFASHVRHSGKQFRIETLSEELVAPIERDYVSHLSELEAICRERGIRFVVANQQASSQPGFGLPAAEREHMKGVRLADEVETIRAKMQRNELIGIDEISLLIHARLQASLEAWARENEVPFVDVIGLLDEDRHLLLSWVHLHPEANRRIAQALAGEILPATCPPTPRALPAGSQ